MKKLRLFIEDNECKLYTIESDELLWVGTKDELCQLLGYDDRLMDGDIVFVYDGVYKIDEEWRNAFEECSE